MVIQAPVEPSVTPFATDVRAGLTKLEQKELPSKYLYDAVGSALFEVISLLPEYGLTRAGARLLGQHAEAIVRPLRSPLLVAELGSGSARNTRLILEALSHRHRITYCPIDISGSALAQAERELDHIEYVSTVGYEREYLEGLEEVAHGRLPGQDMLVLFLGGTIGNFDRKAGDEFLRRVRALMLPGDRMVLSTDLQKPLSRLKLAYDDPSGVTAAFNLNLLARINRELDGNFALPRFRHMVRYDPVEQRIEMHLRSTTLQSVRVGRSGIEIPFRAGETIWTESSHKYAREEIPLMAERTGYHCEAQWVDREWPFAQNRFVAV